RLCARRSPSDLATRRPASKARRGGPAPRAPAERAEVRRGARFGGELWYNGNGAWQKRAFREKCGLEYPQRNDAQGKGIAMTQLSNVFGSRSTFDTGRGEAVIYRLDSLAKAGIADVSRLPVSLRVLLENLLRNFDGRLVTEEQI